MVAVVLLGAGASFGSGDVHPNPPPLGDKLFARLVAEVGLPRDFPADLAQIFTSNFETGMAAYFERSGKNVMEFQRRIAYFLARFYAGPSNLYLQLIDALGVDDVIYASLNYDLLFEQSAWKLGYRTIHDSGVKNAKEVRMLKLHGSCNFWPNRGNNVFTRCTSTGNEKGDVSAPIQVLGLEETLHRCQTDDSFAPAMALYTEGKPVRVCEEAVLSQQEQWRSWIERANSIFVIGVKVHPADDHIWHPLANSAAPLTYFGATKSDRDDFDKWKAGTGKHNAYFIEGDFSCSVRFLSHSFSHLWPGPSTDGYPRATAAPANS